MSRCTFRLLVLAVVLLWSMPGYAEADDTILGQPKADSLEYKPNRHVIPTELLPIEVNGKWGYADRRGDVVVEPRYDWVDYIYGPIEYSQIEKRTWSARYMSEGKMGWMVFTGSTRNKSGSLKASNFHVYGSGKTDRFSESYIVASYGPDNDRRYFIKRAGGDRVTDPPYTGVLRMAGGLAAVELDGRCGFVDKRGKVTIPMVFAEVRSYWDGLAAVRFSEAQGGGWGFIGKTGKVRFRDKAGEIEELRSYHGSLAAVKVRGKWGFLDKAQRARVKPIYDEVRDFVGGIAAVRRGDAWGYIDVTGKEVAWGYDGAWSPEDETRTGAWGEGEEIYPVNLGLILQDGGYGYVDRTGRVKIEPRFKKALPFFRGLARVNCGDSFAYIDSRGRVVWDPRRVSRYGIRGLNLAPAIEPQWPGLPQPDGSSGEPYPFEYDVDDLLPFKRQGSNEKPNQIKRELPGDSN